MFWDMRMEIRKSKGSPDNKVSKINRLAVSLSAILILTLEIHA